MDITNYLSQINSSTESIYILIRALIVFIFATLFIRLNKRMHLETSFDFVLTIMLGAVLERGIFNDSSDLIQSLAVTSLLVIAYRSISTITYISKFWGRIFKGKCVVLYDKGKFDRKKMKILQITEDDIMAACRETLKCSALNKVARVNLERTGKFSFIMETGRNND